MMAVRDPSEFDYDLLAWAEDCIEQGHLPVLMSVGEAHMGWHTFSSETPWEQHDVSTVIEAAIRARRALEAMRDDDGSS